MQLASRSTQSCYSLDGLKYYQISAIFTSTRSRFVPLGCSRERWGGVLSRRPAQSNAALKHGSARSLCFDLCTYSCRWPPQSSWIRSRRLPSHRSQCSGIGKNQPPPSIVRQSHDLTEPQLPPTAVSSFCYGRASTPTYCSAVVLLWPGYQAVPRVIYNTETTQPPLGQTRLPVGQVNCTVQIRDYLDRLFTDSFNEPSALNLHPKQARSGLSGHRHKGSTIIQRVPYRITTSPECCLCLLSHLLCLPCEFPMSASLGGQLWLNIYVIPT